MVCGWSWSSSEPEAYKSVDNIKMLGTVGSEMIDYWYAIVVGVYI